MPRGRRKGLKRGRGMRHFESREYGTIRREENGELWSGA